MKGSIESERAKLPLRRLMEQHGDHVGEKKSGFECPFCHKKKTALREHRGRQWFKCFTAGCPSGTSDAKGSWDEVAYLAFKLGLSREEAFKQFLKMTREWRENFHASSIMPGQKARRAPDPKPAQEEEALLQEATALARAEGKLNVSLLMQRLDLGVGRAEGVLRELERRGVIDPQSSEELGHPFILILPASEAKNSLSPSGPALPTTSTAPMEHPAPAASSSGVNPATEVFPASSAAGSFSSAAPASRASTPDNVVALPGASAPTQNENSGGGRPPGRGGGGDDEASDGVRAAWREFYNQLTLTTADKALIWRKRGLPMEAIEAFGFKSSLKTNKKILEELGEKYPVEDLLEAGLWAEDEKTGKVGPAAQLYGFGNTGKKDASGELIWSWTAHPILIPYFDEAGEVIRMRPHKGGLRGVSAQLFVARFSKAYRERVGAETVTSGSCAITEGEFKACAIYWGTKRMVLAGAIPGISTAKNWLVQTQVKRWLGRECVSRKVAVGFDNEEKGDPNLPGFKPDKRKRFDAEVWARFLAIVLERDGFDARVCQLPEEWRDAHGKADWDGALARMTDASKVTLELSDDSYELQADPISREFTQALRASIRPKEIRQAHLFSSDAESIIANELERKFYVPRLPFGGEAEQKLAAKLRRMARAELAGVPGVLALAEQYRVVIGGHYILKPLSEKKHAEIAELKREEEKRSSVNHDKVWFYEKKLEGIPEFVSNFECECVFRLRRVDGTRDLMVKLRNSVGEKSGLVPLDSESMSQPSKFRVWLSNQGGYGWRAGERELQDFGLDMQHAAAYREVQQVPLMGWHEESGLWFFGDGAFAPDTSVMLKADEDGVYWWNGKGYLVSNQGTDGQDFRLGTPLMHPGMVLQWVENHDPVNPDFRLVEARDARTDEAGPLRDLLEQLTGRLDDTLGGMEGHLVLGMILAYAGAPEFFRKERAFPGLWTHGERGEGKTTACMWVMECWGFHQLSSGIGLLKNSTPVGIQIAAEQYSNLPVWLSEFRRAEIDGEKRAVIHSAFNRELPSKWAANGVMRRLRTSFLIDGESTSGDSATQQRYAHCLVSRARRRGNHWEWFERNRGFSSASAGRCCRGERSLCA